MSQKQYWKGLEELDNPVAHQESVANEFKESLPLADISDSMLDATTPRRDFLKYLGFSTAAAMLAASCEMPVRRAIPYAIKPEDIVPGVANYYASSFVDGGDYCAVVIKTRDGRPIKIEGNPLSSVTKGGTSARVQASVLNLYDKTRIRQPFADGKAVDMYEAMDRQIGELLTANAGKSFVILTSSILSPTTKDIIAAFIAKYPNAKHVVSDPVSYSGMLMANEACYGTRTLPTYHFDKANTIVSLGADFLGTWLSPVEFAKAYGVGRKISMAKPQMSRHYHVEGHHTITGANADHRAVCKPSEMGSVAVALYNAVVNGTEASFKNHALNELVKNAAKDLKAGNGMVVCGSNDVNVQTVINAINDKIGANGTTINWAVTSNQKQGVDQDLVTLVNDMNAGAVGALFIHNINPAYEYFDSAKFISGLAKVPVTVSFADRMDETAQHCKFILPDHHYLESWGDAEPKPGYISLMQPGIAPIFKTRAWQDSLMKWSGSASNYGEYWKNYWTTKLGGQANLDKALQDGVIEPAGPMANGGAAFAGNVAGATAAIRPGSAEGKVELVIYEKVSIGHGGAWSNNPWLQEMPDPITKATWDNYLCVSPKRAKLLKDELTSITEVEANKKVVRVKVNGKEILLPIVAIPGMHNDVVSVAVGYGRHEKVGRAAANTGKNAYPLIAWNDQSKGFEYSGLAEVDNSTEDDYPIAITQTHHSREGRAILHEYTLEEFTHHPNHLIDERYEELESFSTLAWEHEEEAGKKHEHHKSVEEMTEELESGYRENGTLYPNYAHPGIHWGMSIDLNSCIGCGACVVGCMAENNVSVVGKKQVIQAHEMHWLHIDRYFSGNPDKADTIQTVFQPMMCQHCDNAPCENVCPVSATNHSSEGLNQMAYNRCIGTKYCANNCPYKVRHFNWMDWNKADCFDDNTYEDGRRDDINDDLTRMVLNPDVTVRSRGVMEKCSFCVQRLQDAKLTAKKEGHPLEDGKAVTACQQACPTEAIVFGNYNDKESAIYKTRRKDQRERTFYVLEQIHTLPNVSYLAKIRNNEKIMGRKDEPEDVLQKEHI